MFLHIISLIACVPLAAAPADAPYHKVLIGPGADAPTESWQIDSKQVTPGCKTPWSIRRVRLHGGKQEGVELIQVDNGVLKLTIVPTRGMGVLSVVRGDIRLGWDSPVKEVVNPQFINLPMRGGLGWLEGFNEWLCRCGMESNGHPGTDKFINNVGEEATMELTLHGRVANLPAQMVEVLVEQEAPYRLRIRGRVEERMFYGPKLELVTELSTEPGSNTFRIADTITNRGAAPQEFEMLYHTNYGRPLLEEGSRFVAPVRQVTPFNGNAAKAIASYSQYMGPTPGFIEQVYCLRLYGDAQDRTLAMLHNQAEDKGVSLAYSIKELPYFSLWKNTTAELDGYVTGLEPGTGFPSNRRIERKAGRVPKLAPGASWPMTIEFTVLSGKDEVRHTADSIKAIQAGRPTKVDEQPEKVE